MIASVFGSGEVQVQQLDIIVIVIYFVLIVGIGLWAGMKRKAHTDSDGYFRAGGTLTWPMIGMALFSTNISTIHMVGFAGQGYSSGLTYGNFEWMAPFLLIVLALFFAPFYLKSRIATLPDFLEKRYCGTCRNLLAILSVLSAVFVHIGFTLYAGALVIKTLFGIPIMTSVIVAAVLTGIYTVVGGLLAVVVTGALQTIVLLAGSIVLTAIAYVKIGGWSGLQEFVEPAKLTILRPSSDPAGLSWYSVFLGYPIIGLWYWCADQTIVQRVLGAKDNNHARIGPLFAGFLKVLPVFIFFLPGLAYLAMVNRGDFAPLGAPDECFSMAIQNLLPAGVTGLMAAALLAALMSTVSGALNSIATLVSYDLYKQWKPKTSDKTLIIVGQIATVVFMIVSIVWSWYVGQFKSLYEGCVAMICYIAPPITTVFLFGVFWKKASNRAAILTMVSGFFLGLFVFLMDWNDWFGWNVEFMMAGFYLFCICSFIMLVASLIWPHKHTDESIKLVWKDLKEAIRDKGWAGIGNYKFLSILLFVTMVVCYVSILKSDPLPAVEVSATQPGLQCNVYSADGANVYAILFATNKPAPAASVPVTAITAQEGMESDKVYEYKGYIDISEESLYQFNLTSAQKMDVRVDNITLTLTDRTPADKKDGLEKTFMGQVSLAKGKHAFAIYYYGSHPWTAFALKDALGKDDENEIERKKNWEQLTRAFTINYLDLNKADAEAVAIPDDLLSYAE